MIKKKVIIIFLTIILTWSTFIGCVSTTDKGTTLQHIVYRSQRDEEDYTVMIKERGEYVPYLVITDNYDNKRNCLLLRKYLLEDYMRYGENSQYNPSYYGNSELGKYINEEFIKLFSKEIQDAILTTSIEIVTYDAISYVSDDTERIDRKIFLMSYSELGYPHSRVKFNEGKSIAYFNSAERRIAYKENGEKGNWWLRTPDYYSIASVLGVTTTGESAYCGISFGNDDYELGVRPAFCLPRNTQIIKEDGVYYIEADYNSPDLRENAEDRTEMLYEDIFVPRMGEEVETVHFSYEPEGYSVNIKSALACQMEAHKEEPDYKFHTIIYSDSLTVWEEVIFDINNNPDNEVYLDMSYWVPKEVNDGFVRFYYILTAAEINALADMDIDCAYVCTGTCNMDKANWDTPEGILEYCELYGDGYVKK